MLSDLGNAHWSSTDPVSRGADGRSPPVDSGLAACIRKGGDETGRLESVPTIARGALDFAEGCPGRYTHLLYVDFYDVGQRKATPREDYADFLVERFSAR